MRTIMRVASMAARGMLIEEVVDMVWKEESVAELDCDGIVVAEEWVVVGRSKEAHGSKGLQE